MSDFRPRVRDLGTISPFKEDLAAFVLAMSHEDVDTATMALDYVESYHPDHLKQVARFIYLQIRERLFHEKPQERFDLELAIHDWFSNHLSPRDLGKISVSFLGDKMENPRILDPEFLARFPKLLFRAGELNRDLLAKLIEDDSTRFHHVDHLIVRGDCSSKYTSLNWTVLNHCPNIDVLEVIPTKKDAEIEWGRLLDKKAHPRVLKLGAKLPGRASMELPFEELEFVGFRVNYGHNFGMWPNLKKITLSAWISSHRALKGIASSPERYPSLEVISFRNVFLKEYGQIVDLLVEKKDTFSKLDAIEFCFSESIEGHEGVFEPLAGAGISYRILDSSAKQG